MILGIMSDTHGNTALMHTVAEMMKTRFHADVIVHLGDDYRDGQELQWAGYDVRLVPGLWCPEYRDKRFPNRLVEDIAGLTVVFVHAEKDLRPEDEDADIVLTGHTHWGDIIRTRGVVQVNPGHLKSNMDRGETPSFAMLNIGPEVIRAAIHEIDGSVRFSQSIPRAGFARGAAAQGE